LYHPHTDPRVDFFDHHAPAWDSYGPPQETTLARLELLRPSLGLGPGQDVLEVGCGTGQTTGWLAHAVAPGRVTAVDFSPRMLEQARTRSVAATFRCADVCTDDLGAACFDAAFCLHVAPHFRDRAAAVRNLSRALRPGGRLIVLHLIGRQAVNHIHAHAGGPVAGDSLPAPTVWRELWRATALQEVLAIDQDDLFLMIAAKAAGPG
jgi:SAM-dependent methyltransferase